jgi:hypothetical protein
MTDSNRSTEGESWVLTTSHINELQAADIDRLIARCAQAHFVNIQVQLRINGSFETVEADWIKHLKRVTEPADHSQLMAFYDAKDTEQLIDRLWKHIDKLQAKLPASGQQARTHVREG